MPPAHVRSLHARAAEWFRSRGHVEEAVQHSLDAGNTEDAASLVQASWLHYVDAGRAATVVGWLESLGPAAIASGPAARVAAAWMTAFVGNESEMVDHLAALEPFLDYGPLPDGSRCVESAVAMIGGIFGYGGPTAMLAASERAVELETDRRSPFYAIAHAALGNSAYIQGDLDRAVAALGPVGRSDDAPKIIKVLALSVESFAEAERGDLARARECAELAMTIVEARGLRVMPQASLAFAALGQAQAAAGKVDEALVTLELGLAMRRQSSAQGLWGPILHLLVTARVAAEAGRSQMARDLLAELATRTGRFPDGMAAMHQRVEAVQSAAPRRSCVAAAQRDPHRSGAGRASVPQPRAEPPRDRRRALPLVQHGEDPRAVGLSQARRPLEDRGTADRTTAVADLARGAGRGPNLTRVRSRRG